MSLPQATQNTENMESNLYETAYEYDMSDAETYDKPLAPWACTACGSRDWPNPHSTCPLCREDEEEPGEPGEPVESEEELCPL